LNHRDRHTLICTLLEADSPMEGVLARGWVRTRRDSKGFSFVELNDGSSIGNLQAVVSEGIEGYPSLKDAVTGASVEVRGDLEPSPGKGQKWDLKASSLRILGAAGPDYPLQKKRHSDEFLRENAHLRPRTNKYGALNRIRSELAFAVHTFFRERRFFHVHTPIITGSDAEGAGELFRVTTLPLAPPPPAPGAPAGAPAPPDPAPSPGRPPGGPGPLNPFARDFFGRQASLTVSGQLEAELMAMGLGRVYTFGPTFRAERSNTPRHAAEFWMVEPEAAFLDLEDDMDLAEELVRFLAGWALDKCQDDLALFDRFVEPGLLKRLEGLRGGPYARVPYDEAVRLLQGSKIDFEFRPEPGSDLQTEHERFLAEACFKGPVFVHDYPKGIKPFYMRLSDDGSRARAMDLLVPKAGELIGGSQREERLDVLLGRMDELGLDQGAYWWYLDSRRFGGAPHSGFGLGFERLLMLRTGVANIRDVIPFPRTPGSLEF
jgi:asparaginyl-tRNA synthetase